jgi:putative membrane protein
MTAKFLRVAPFAAWTIVSLILFFTGDWKTFIAPRFFWLLPLTAFFSAAFFIAEWTQKEKAPPSVAWILERTLFLLAIIPVITISGQVLDSSDVEQRWGRMVKSTETMATASPVEKKTSVPLIEKKASESEAEETSKTTEDFLQDREIAQEKAEEDGTYFVRIPDLFKDSEKWEGRKVSFEGYFLKHKNVAKDFGESAVAVYRFSVTCCVADARPLVVVVMPSEKTELKDDTWVKVTGKYSVKRGDFGRAAYLEEAIILPTEMKEDPYLY